MMTEEDVVVKHIVPLIQELGYSEDKENEIQYNKAVTIGRGTRVFPDIYIQIEGCPAIVMDAKGPRENLDAYKKQVISYGLLLKTPYSVLVNDREAIVFNTYKEEEVWRGSYDEPPIILEKDSLKQKIQKSIEPVTEEQKEEAKKTLRVFQGIEELSKVLHKCENIVRDLDGLTGADAFDELSKLLFTKMYFERNNQSQAFAWEEIKKRGGVSWLKNYLFSEAVKKNSDIFQGDESLRLTSPTLKRLVKILEPYTLSETDVDVKGRAFEIFLGKTFTGALGQFFTPRSIVDFMVKFCDPPPRRSRDPNEPYRVIDPACGSGGFLTQVYQLMHKKLKAKFPENQKWEKQLSHEQIHGVDISGRLVRTAKMNMVLHGDGHGNIIEANGLKFEAEEEYDLVIANPPFGNKDEGDILKKFELGHKKSGGTYKKQDREVLFVEKCINLCKKNGQIAILLPDGILNNSQDRKVRHYIKRHTIIEAVIGLPDRTFKAADANSKCSILFLRKKERPDEQQPPIFMAVAEEVGFERKTKNAYPIDKNDLPDIYDEFREYRGSGVSNELRNNTNIIRRLNSEPQCFLIGKDNLEGRLDASYYFSEHFYELPQKSCRIGEIAEISYTKVDPSNTPEEEIQYIQFGDIEEDLGSISNVQSMLGKKAPGRAKYMVRAGTVIAASVKDSERNVALIPDELDGVIVSNGFLPLQPKNGMTSEALYVLMRRETTTEQVRHRTTGTIMPSISDENLYLQIKVPYLDSEEIAEITSEVKDIEQKRYEIRKQLKELEESRTL